MSWIGDTFFGGSAKDAAAKQVESLEKAMDIQRQFSEQARNDVLSLFGPGYQDYMDSFANSQDLIASGRQSTSDILKSATAQANRTLAQGTQSGLQALLGRPVDMQYIQQQQPPTPVQQPDPGDVIGGPAPQPTEPVNPTIPGMPQPGTPDPGLPGDQPQPPGGGLPPKKEGGPIMQKGIVTGAPVGNVSAMSQSVNPTMVNATKAQPPGSVIGAPVPGDGIPSLPGGAGQGFQLPSQGLSTPNVQQIQGALPSQMNIGDLGAIGLYGAEQSLMQGGAGAEQALAGGLQGATNTYTSALQNQLGVLGRSQQQGRGDIMQGMNQAGGSIQGALGDTLGIYGQALQQGRGDIQSGLQGLLGALGGTERRATGAIGGATSAATGRLDPYAQAGGSALQREAALTGALGADAQAQAFQNYQSSPGQEWLRDRQEQSLLRNASATGGLRGGSTLTALQEQAAGFASQQYQQDLDNLRNLSGRGQQAAGQQAGIQQQGGLAQGNIISSLGQMGAQGQMQAGSQLSNLASQFGQLGGAATQQAGQNMANIYGQGAQSLANQGLQYGQLGSGAIGQAGGQIGQAQLGTGQNLSQLRNMLGQNIGNLRMGAGQQAAQQIQGATQGIAQNQLGLGSSLAGLDQNTLNQLSQIQLGQGEAGINSRMQLAQILANLASGQGTNLSGLQGQIGSAQAGGITGAASGAQGGIGTLVGLASAFSDIRLKDNVTKIGESDGLGLYSWTWKDELVVADKAGQTDYGVLAQEVAELYPQHIGERDGYMTVNYAGLAQELMQ